MSTTKIGSTFSAGNSKEGTELKLFCEEYGFEQYVKAPTRDNYLLDLVLTDVGVNISCYTQCGVSDYLIVISYFDIAIARMSPIQRTVWDFRNAKWREFAQVLADTDW